MQNKKKEDAETGILLIQGDHLVLDMFLLNFRVLNFPKLT